MKPVLKDAIRIIKPVARKLRISNKELKAVVRETGKLTYAITKMSLIARDAGISLKDFSRSLLLFDTLRRLKDVKRLRREIIQTKKL